MSNCRRGGSDLKTVKLLIERLQTINLYYPGTHDIAITSRSGSVVVSTAEEPSNEIGEIVKRLALTSAQLCDMFSTEPMVLHIQGTKTLFSVYEIGEFWTSFYTKLPLAEMEISDDEPTAARLNYSTTDEESPSDSSDSDITAASTSTSRNPSLGSHGSSRGSIGSNSGTISGSQRVFGDLEIPEGASVNLENTSRRDQRVQSLLDEIATFINAAIDNGKLVVEAVAAES